MARARAQTGDLAAALALWIGAGVIAQQSTIWPQPADVAGDPTVFPRVVAGLMAGVGLLLATRVLPTPGEEEETDAASLRRVLLSIAATLGLALSLEFLGLIPAGFLYVLALQAITGAAIRTALPFAIGAPIVIWLGFATALKVPLPWGRLLPLAGF